tara:strand:- start:78 stop:698 length:621 start_codon:yes stop_codon:yes gene_type:complete
MPVTYSYDKGKFMRPTQVMTTVEGKVNIKITDINIGNPNNRLVIEVDLQQVIDPTLDKRFTRPLLQTMKNEKREIPINIDLPIAYMESHELSFGAETNSKILASTLQNELTKKGIHFTSIKEIADFAIKVSGNTTKGGTSQGFHVAYLEMRVEVVDNENGSQVYSQAINNIKGLQLNFDAASGDAYKRASKKIESEIIDELITTIF